MTVLLLFIVFLFRYLSLRKKKRLDPYSICDEKLLSAKKAVKAAGIIAAVFIALFVGRYAFLGLVMMFM
ncbi:MAG: hypothetical protein IJS90_03535 [Clostridia bacterium]|nr:hypothetical protein [Clostridia bacterium]